MAKSVSFSDGWKYWIRFPATVDRWCWSSCVPTHVIHRINLRYEKESVKEIMSDKIRQDRNKGVTGK